MATFFHIIIYLSALGFWAIIGYSTYHISKEKSGVDDKVITKEQINAVKTNTVTGDKIHIQ